MGNQCNAFNTGVMWSNLRVPVSNLADANLNIIISNHNNSGNVAYEN